MIVDLRTYTMVPGRLKAFLELYEREGLPVQCRHQGKPLGYFITEIWTNNQVVHLCVGADAEMSHRAGVRLSHLGTLRDKSRKGLTAKIGGSLDGRQTHRKWLISASAPTGSSPARLRTRTSGHTRTMAQSIGDSASAALSRVRLVGPGASLWG